MRLLFSRRICGNFSANAHCTKLDPIWSYHETNGLHRFGLSHGGSHNFTMVSKKERWYEIHICVPKCKVDTVNLFHGRPFQKFFLVLKTLNRSSSLSWRTCSAPNQSVLVLLGQNIAVKFCFWVKLEKCCKVVLPFFKPDLQFLLKNTVLGKKGPRRGSDRWRLF